MTRQLHLNAFLMGCGHHQAAWRLPDSDPFAHTDLAHGINLAQIAERGTFDSVFLADAPALWGGATPWRFHPDRGWSSSAQTIDTGRRWR